MQFNYVYGENIEREHPEIKLSIERITPEVAERMLLANTHNRNLLVNSIDKAIINGEWVINGATIVFSDDGVLLDGQHRLKECVNTGKAIETVVVRGIKQESQMSMDTGVKRKVAHYIKMMGYPEVNLTTAIGLALQRSDEYGVESGFNKGNNATCTLKSSVDFIARNYEKRIRPIIRTCVCVQRQYKGVNSGTIAVFVDYLKMHGVDEADISLFFDQLNKKVPPTSTVLALQKRLDANAKSTTGKLPQKVIAALIIKAWNAYMTGEDLKVLMFKQGGAVREKFPDIMCGYDD